jgi:hypothetical protein
MFAESACWRHELEARCNAVTVFTALQRVVGHAEPTELRCFGDHDEYKNYELPVLCIEALHGFSHMAGPPFQSQEQPIVTKPPADV